MFTAAIVVLFAMVLTGAGVVLSENALATKLPARPFTGPTDLTGEAVSIRGAAGAELKASWYRPQSPNGNCLILLHGIADTRASGIPVARMFLRHGYSVLLPDSRGHGESTGAITFGWFESDDVVRWVEWLSGGRCSGGLYGLGESMGAGTLLVSLGKTQRFRAVAAECPFTSFTDVARLRLVQNVPVRPGITAWAASPVVWSALVWNRWRSGVDLAAISPEKAVASTRTPVLLIHGLRDDNIPPVHSERIARVRQAAVELWLVPGAGHTAAFGTAPEEFERRVVGWFAGHP